MQGQGGSEEDDFARGKDPSSSPSGIYEQTRAVSEDFEKELEKFSGKVKKQDQPELDRDLAEVKIDIDFLESQIKADFGCYSPQELQRAQARVLFLKRKAEIIEKELSKKKRSSLPTD